jgi:hypothetical protein
MIVNAVCAWCNMPLASDPTGGNPVSHGICRRCVEYVLSERATFGQFLETIDAPILAVDGEGKAILANGRALRAFGDNHGSAAGKLPGEVIECEHSIAPQRCGRTIHCTGCEIRGSVDRTRATGEAVVRKKSYQHIMTPDGVRTYDYYISTEKLDDGVVLLRIDKARETDGGAV